MLNTIMLIGGLIGVCAAIFLALTAIGVFTDEARGVSKSLAVMQAFSAAPADMRREMEPSFQDRVLDPLLGKTLNLGKKLTPADHNERIRQKLEIAGNPPGWTIDRVTSLKFIGFVVALVLGLVVTMLFSLGLLPTLAVCMVLSVLGYMSPNLYLYQKGYDRTQKMQ